MLASASQISLEVDAESTGRLTERPSISNTDTVIGFLVLVACRRAEEKDHVIKLERVTCDYFFLTTFKHLSTCSSSQAGGSPRTPFIPVRCSRLVQ